MSVDIAVPELAVTSLPRLLACRPWQAASASSGNCIAVTAGNHHPHIGEQGRVLVFRQQFRSVFAVFSRKKTYCLAICTKHERCFSTSSRAKVFSRLKLVWAANLRKTFLRPKSAKISFSYHLTLVVFNSLLAVKNFFQSLRALTVNNQIDEEH